MVGSYHVRVTNLLMLLLIETKWVLIMNEYDVLSCINQMR